MNEQNESSNSAENSTQLRPMKRRNHSKRQMDKLLSIIGKQTFHGKTTHYFSNDDNTRWENIAAELNSIDGGTVKTAKGWRRVLSDAKFRTLKKLQCNNTNDFTLSEQEDRIISIFKLSSNSSPDSTLKTKTDKSKSSSEIQEIPMCTDADISHNEEVSKCFSPVCTKSVTKLQKYKLLSIIEKQPYLGIKGRYAPWENAAAELNSFVGGAVKTAKQWKKVWTDAKFRTLKKLPCDNSSLTKMDKRIIAVANLCSEFISDSTPKADIDKSKSSSKIQEIHQSTSASDKNISCNYDSCDVQENSMCIIPDKDISHINEVSNEQKTPMCTIPDKNSSLIGKVIKIQNTTSTKIPDKKFISIVPIRNLSHRTPTGTIPNRNIFYLDKSCHIQKSPCTVSNQNVLPIDKSCLAQKTPTSTISNVQNPVLKLENNSLKTLYLNKDSESQSQEAIFGINVGQQLEQMDFKQKIIAQKLISDVLYYANMVKLNESSNISNQ